MTDTSQRHIFQSLRSDIAQTQLVSTDISPIGDGEVLVAVDKFAITANNVTYGIAGDTIGYWKFFPAHDPKEEGFGCIPVWGFGDVVRSNHPDVPVGERLYGYFPMASHVVLAPNKVTAHGLVDGVAHRAALPVVYNQYTRCTADPAYSADLEAEQMLYRPLFTTSFFLDDFLDDKQFFGADKVLLTSASSKTSIGLAQLLSANRSCRVIGLTSKGNQKFVERLGCYHDVLSYEAVDKLEQAPTVMVDMAGNADVRRAVHTHLDTNLKYSCAVGATHWESATLGGGQDGGQTGLPGPKPEMFFAPAQIQKRLKEWGRDAYEQKMSLAWGEFLQAAAGWIEVDSSAGEAAVARVYKAFIEGRADPARGYVVSLAS